MVKRLQHADRVGVTSSQSAMHRDTHGMTILCVLRRLSSQSCRLRGGPRIRIIQQEEMVLHPRASRIPAVFAVLSGAALLYADAVAPLVLSPQTGWHFASAVRWVWLAFAAAGERASGCRVHGYACGGRRNRMCRIASPISRLRVLQSCIRYSPEARSTQSRCAVPNACRCCQTLLFAEAWEH